MSQQDKNSNSEEELRYKRLSTLIGLWGFCVEIGLFDPNRLKLSKPLTNEVVEHYIADQRVLKTRYKISERILPSKVAGLMTSSLLRYRPIAPIVDEISKDEIYANETFAIIHGLSLCGEFNRDDEALKALFKNDKFISWMEDFKFLLHYRNYTPEALSFIYETLTLVQPPFNLPPVNTLKG
jgi:hypothetical protein